MQPAIQQERPPFVQFEVRSIEDRNASIEQGRYVGVDTDFAIITPVGSKDRIERVASEWLAKIKLDEANNRCPKGWYASFKGMYEEWKAGNEVPLNGTSLREWPLLTPTQLKTLQSINVHTIEDLAQANEETIMRLGMGGRDLKQKAQDWLAKAKDSGQIVAELAALRARLENVETRNKELEARNKALEEAVEAAKTPPQKL